MAELSTKFMVSIILILLGIGLILYSFNVECPSTITQEVAGQEVQVQVPEFLLKGACIAGQADTLISSLLGSVFLLGGAGFLVSTIKKALGD